MKYIISLFFVLLLLPAAIAISVDVDPQSVDEGSTITLTLSGCPADSISFLRVINPQELIMLDVFQGSGDFSAEYNTKTDPTIGTFEVRGSCDGKQALASFCVGTDECVSDDVETGSNDEDDSDGNSGSSSSTPKSSGSSGGLNKCNAQWSCNEWSFCNATLQQERSCYDLTNCAKPKVEKQSCDACIESWTCSVWSSCSYGKQVRTCVDQHACGTVTQMPAEQKACDGVALGPAPSQIVDTLPPGTTETFEPQGVTSSSFSSFWEKWSLWIYAVGGGLLLLILILILVLHFFKPKQKVYNHGELVDWMRKEQEMGTSVPEIKKILAQNTGWTSEEIEHAFEELREESASTPTSA